MVLEDAQKQTNEPKKTQAGVSKKRQAGVPEKTQADKTYIWYEMGFFTRWDHSGHCRVICIDTPEDLQSGLEIFLRKHPPLNFSDPFAMHVPLIDQIILQYDLSVWRVRRPVRDIEKVSTSIMLPKGIADKYRLEQTRRHTRFWRYARDLQARDPRFRGPVSDNRNNGRNSTTAESDLRKFIF
jgi:hypothetical protein